MTAAEFTQRHLPGRGPDAFACPLSYHAWADRVPVVHGCRWNTAVPVASPWVSWASAASIRRQDAGAAASASSRTCRSQQGISGEKGVKRALPDAMGTPPPAASATARGRAALGRARRPRPPDDGGAWSVASVGRLLLAVHYGGADDHVGGASVPAVCEFLIDPASVVRAISADIGTPPGWPNTLSFCSSVRYLADACGSALAPSRAESVR